jgi:hypothetical protein
MQKYKKKLKNMYRMGNYFVILSPNLYNNNFKTITL